MGGVLMSFNSSDEIYKEIKKCSDCNCKIFETLNKTGEEVCSDCGLVYSNVSIDEGPDWNNYQDNSAAENGDRAGMPSTNLLHDKGLTTDIGWKKFNNEQQ